MSKFVDKDKKKQNLFFYDKKIGIDSIESLKKIRPDLIVITSYYSSLIIFAILAGSRNKIKNVFVPCCIACNV